MADQKISALDAKAAAAVGDLMAVVDVAAAPDKTKKMLVENFLAFLLKAETELTIAGGVITVTHFRHKVDTAGDGATDDLDTINGGATIPLIILRPENDARTVVIKHNTGNIWLKGENDISLDDIEDGLILAWDATNSMWFDIGGGGLADDFITGAHLSQTFGASSLRLHAWNFTPKQGKAFQCNNNATSPFDADIAADGGGGGNLSSTNIPFDGETNLNCLKNLNAGAGYWGRFVLHNSTKAESVQIVDFNETLKFLTVEANSPDDSSTWAENDVITMQSITCAQAGYMDLNLSDEISANEAVILLQFEALDKSAGAQAGRRLILHQFSAYDAGKRLMCPAALASEFTAVPGIISVTSQKICVFFDDFSDAACAVSVLAALEYADT